MKTIKIMTALALAAVPAGLSAQSASEVNASATVEATAKAGLPEAPVRRTVEQGRARGASEAQIGRAALAAHARLAAARESLRREERPEPTQAEIMAGADAMLSGASESDLRRVRDAAPEGRSLAASLSVLAELTARGESSTRAAEAIAGRLRAGYDDRAVAGLVADGALSIGADGGVGGTRVDALTGAGVGVDVLGTTSSVSGQLTAGVTGL